ncbi:MAG: hypothetical protein ABIR11_11045 [Candidatus Limnocylindrales bacterium]
MSVRPGLVALAVALALALAASWFAPLAGIGSAPVALGASTDLTLVTDTVYTVQPDLGRVRVGMTIVARNNTRESRTRKFFFDHAFLAVLPTASDVKITGAGGARVRVTKRTKDAALLRIDFGSRLYSGMSRTLKVTFSLVDKGTPSARPIRVGTSLVTLPVWAHASNGARGSTVRVRFPADYDVFVESGSFASRSTLADGGTELATGSLLSPLTFFAYVSAQKPATYADSLLAIPAGDESIALTMRGWTDDPAWATRVGGLFARSLPVLRQEIGLPWPHAEPMVVQEAVSRSAGGYAGLFDPVARRIEVAYWADHLVVIHEAAHGWFNGTLLADRWANEGFASLYAGRAAAAIKEGGASPVLTDALKKAAIPLNAWAVQPAPTTTSPGDAATDAARATESYGYAASLVLATATAERAGDDALRGVWADAAAGTGAYQPIDVGAAGTAGSGDAALETVGGPPDWRRLLDLLEARTGKDFSDLWREWVVRPDETALLDERATARQSYARTLALADGWVLPRSIRDALRAWQFDRAEQLMADARTVLAQRGAVESLAARDGLELPPTMQARFEDGQLIDASAVAESQRNAMLVIAEATAARSAREDPLTAIGMIGESPDADIAAAKAALATGDLETTVSSAEDAYRAWTGAWQEGRRRALLLVALLATVLVLGSAIVGRARKARAARGAFAVAGSGGEVRSTMPATKRSTVLAAAIEEPDPTPEELLAAATPHPETLTTTTPSVSAASAPEPPAPA